VEGQYAHQLITTEEAREEKCMEEAMVLADHVFKMDMESHL